MFRGIFQPTHLLIILVIALIIFGPGKLPELGEALARPSGGSKKRWKNRKRNLLRKRRPKKQKIKKVPEEKYL